MANTANTAGNLKNNKKSFPVFVRECFAELGRAGPLAAWEKVSQLGWEEEPAPSHRLPPHCYPTPVGCYSTNTPNNGLPGTLKYSKPSCIEEE